MPDKRLMVLEFPAGGIDRGKSFQRQPPYTTPYAVNVRPRSSIQERSRGGSRSMLVKHSEDQLGTATYRPIRMIAICNTATSVSIQQWATNWASGTGSWVNNAFQTSPDGWIYDRSDGGTSPDLGVHSIPGNLVATEPFTISIPMSRKATGLYPLGGTLILGYGLSAYTDWTAATGKTYAYLEAFRTGANKEVLVFHWHKIVAGVDTEIGTASYAGIANDGTAEIILKLVVDGMDVSYYYNDTLLGTTTVAGAFSGTKIGLWIESQDTKAWQTQVPTFMAADDLTLDYSVVSYEASATNAIYSAGGLVYIEDPVDGDINVATEAWTAAGYFAVSPLHQIRAVEMFGKLYIADYSTPRKSGNDGIIGASPFTAFDVSGTFDWTTLATAGHKAADTAIIPTSDVLVITGSSLGNDGVYLITVLAAGSLTISPAATAAESGLTYTIMRSPKVLDLATGDLEVWKTATPATDGWVPTGCPLIARFGGRIYLAGEANNPHVWYACEMGNPLDFDYIETGGKQAISGTSAAEGVIADAITALCPINEDIMCMAAASSMYSMRGNLADGGEIISLSYEVGCIGADVWATTPEGILIFMSRIGLYIVDPTSGAFQSYNAQPFSRRKLPVDLVGIKDSDYWASMAYSGQDEGIHLYLSPRGGGFGTHWFFDWQNKSPFMTLLNADHQPCAIGKWRDGTLLLGGLDGYLRKYDPDALTDDGTVVTSGVFVGPFAIAGPGRTGCLDSIQAVMGEGSSDVTWAVVVGNTAEEAYQGDAFASGTFVAGPNYTEWPRAGGAAAYLLLASTGRWAMESLVLSIRDAGPLRLA